MDDQSQDIEIQDEELLFEHFRITVDAGQEQMRIDKFLMDRIPNTSRNRIQNGIKDSFVKVNGSPIKANYKVRPEDEIIISFPSPPHNEDLKPEKLDIDIRYEDDDVMIIHKSPGMVVHPGYNNWDGTLVNGLLYHMNNLPTNANGEARPGLVHRIDKDTSGLMVIAKTEEAMTSLAKQFFDHSVERTYYALVWGVPKEPKGTITGHIGRSLKDRKVMTVFPDGEFGKHAVTHYEVIKDLHYVSLVKCNLETGRTHQIRAHMKFLGHPLFNDWTYGGDKVLRGEVFTKYKQFVKNTFEVLPRQALHAKTLGFDHPRTGKRVNFDSEVPDDILAALDRWTKYIDQMNPNE